MVRAFTKQKYQFVMCTFWMYFRRENHNIRIFMTRSSSQGVLTYFRRTFKTRKNFLILTLMVKNYFQRSIFWNSIFHHFSFKIGKVFFVELSGTVEYSVRPGKKILNYKYVQKSEIFFFRKDSTKIDKIQEVYTPPQNPCFVGGGLTA